MSNTEYLEEVLNPTKMSIKPELQFDSEYRKQFKMLDEELTPPEVGHPFEKTIAQLKEIKDNLSPMGKLELIYNCCA